jgi:nicotinate-nucleotide adenylyltransferase
MTLLGKNNKIKNLIFGGTFDPIHYGHIEIVKKIISYFSPEKIYVIPSGNPYMKPKPPIASPLQRLQMCKIAFNDFNCVNIIDYEVYRSSPSYTVDTINFMSSKNIIIDTLALGEDSYLELDSWKEGDFLKRKFNFVVIKRSKSSNLSTSKSDCFYLEKISSLSSSDIRKKIASNKSIKNDTPIEIENYIEDNMLYKNGQSK